MGGKAIPDIAYRIYQKNFQEPTKNEGFTQIYQFKKVCGVAPNSPLYKYYF